jgi:hypothetical protein
MKLTLLRRPSAHGCTLGSLYVDGAFECYTLEDVVRADGIKIAGETAIPAGTYTIDITMSPRFGCLLPLLLSVGGFVGIRIHPGNSAKNTDGCILVGRDVMGDAWISDSRRAFEALFAKLQAAHAKGEAISIEVKNP